MVYIIVKRSIIGLILGFFVIGLVEGCAGSKAPEVAIQVPRCDQKEKEMLSRLNLHDVDDIIFIDSRSDSIKTIEPEIRSVTGNGLNVCKEQYDQDEMKIEQIGTSLQFFPPFNIKHDGTVILCSHGLTGSYNRK